MKVRFTQKKVNGDKYYRFKVSEDNQAQRLSKKYVRHERQYGKYQRRGQGISRI